jgi:OOP family OmpA-OmpF porin
MAILAALAMLWFGFRIYQGRRWDRAVTALQAAPGILVTNGGRQGGSYFIDGFRDPLAESPQNVLARRGIDVQDVALRFRPFLSLDPNLTLERARISLQPPEGVSMGLDQDILSIRGTAPHDWILQTKNAAAQLRMLGIREIRTTDLRDRDLEALRTRIEGHEQRKGTH